MKRTKSFRNLQSKICRWLKEDGHIYDKVEEMMMEYINSTRNGTRDDILAAAIEELLETL